MELITHCKQAHDDFFKSTHQPGVLDVKTKMLIHIALSLAMRCEPWVENNLAVARERIGITEEELAECIQLAASVGARSITAMAKRASKRSEQGNNSLSSLI